MQIELKIDENTGFRIKIKTDLSFSRITEGIIDSKKQDSSIALNKVSDK